MSDPKGYYATLGVNEDAGLDAIKSAYRKLAKQYHPDVNSSDNAKDEMIKINDAYNVLSDDQKRKEYDSGITNDQGYEHIQWSDINHDFMWSPFDFMRPRHMHVNNSNQNIQMHIDPQRLFSKENIFEITYKSIYMCPQCQGTGASKLETCAACNGSGSQVSQYGQHGHWIQSISECKFCNGSGKKIIEGCGSCRGSGHEDKVHKVSIDNQTLNYNRVHRFPEKGHQDISSQAPPGDLYLMVEIKIPNGNVDSDYNVHITEELNMLQLAIEDNYLVKGLNNETHTIKLQSSNLEYRIPGGGLPLFGEKRSNLIVHVKPIIYAIKDAELVQRIKDTCLK